MVSRPVVDAVLGEDSDVGWDERKIVDPLGWVQQQPLWGLLFLRTLAEGRGQHVRLCAEESWRWQTECTAKWTRRNLHCVKKVSDSDRQPSSIVCHSV